MQCSECQSGEKFKQTRVNGGIIYDSLKVTSSECQSNGNLKQAWVNGGRGHDSLKIASALNFKVMEIQTRVAPAELRLRDDLEEVCALLFRFLGFGFRLAMSNMGWHETQKFVILVPDPIGFAPWPVLLDPGEPCDICQYTSSRLSLRGFVSHQGTKTTWAMAFPRINCLQQSHCASCVFVLPFVPSPITSPSAADAAQRLR